MTGSPTSTDCVLTVVASELDAAVEESLLTAVAEAGAEVLSARRVADAGLAGLVLHVTGVDPAPLRAAADRATGAASGAAAGWCVVPALPQTGPMLLMMDVDSTLIRDEVIELLARFAGREAEVAAVTEAAMRGELDFAESLHARVATLAGLPADVIERTRAEIRLTPGADRLCRVLHEAGHRVGLVSGGFTAVIEPLATALGIQDVRANTLEIVDGHLTGRVLGEVVDRAVKARTLREVAAREGIPRERTVAIGDGANDLGLLAVAGVGLAFNAKPVLRAAADGVLDLPRLDAALLLLGMAQPATQPDARSSAQSD